MIVSNDRQLEGTVQLGYRYELTSRKVVDGEEDIRYTTYGISAVNQNGEVVVSHPDVSTDKVFMIRLVERCNNGQLDALHLRDVIIDSLD